MWNVGKKIRYGDSTDVEKWCVWVCVSLKNSLENKAQFLFKSVFL